MRPNENIALTRNVSIVSINCFIDRASRSSFHTIRVSPWRAKSRASRKADLRGRFFPQAINGCKY